MSSTTVIRALRKWWWAVVSLTLIGGVAGGALTYATAPTYSSTAQLVVAYDAPAGSGSAELVQANNFAIQKVYAYQEIATSPRVLDEVIDELNLDATARELGRDLSVSVPLNTPIMQLTASAGSPEDAETLASAFAVAFSEAVIDIETPSAGGAAPVRIESLEEPQVPLSPSSPDLVSNVAVGLAAGLAVGIIWLAVAAASDRRIHGAKTVTGSSATAGARVLGSIPHGPGSHGAAVLEKPQGTVAEAYRTVAATLGRTPGAQLGVVAVAPVTPRDTTAPVAANLALALQEFGIRVVLVDANLRSAATTAALGLSGPGLSEVLRGTATLTEAVRPVGGVGVLPAGATTDNPAELLSGPGFAALLAELSAHADTVIVDAAPALPLSDTIFAATVAQTTVLTVTAGRATSAQLVAAGDALEAVGAHVAGVVVSEAATSGVDADASTVLFRDLRPARG